MTGYPRRFEGALWFVLVACAVSGLLLVPGSIELRWQYPVPWRLPPGSGRGAASVHGVAASIFTGLFGAIWVVHMRSGWRRRRHLPSGLGSAALLGGLIATGWGVYYAADRVGAWTSALHTVVGLAVTVVVWAHVRAGKRDPSDG